MTHFFGRLAASVTRPPTEPRLRPLLGSIYRPADLLTPPGAPLTPGDSPTPTGLSTTESTSAGENLRPAGTSHPSIARLRPPVAEPPASSEASTHVTRPEAFAPAPHLPLPGRHPERLPAIAAPVPEQRNPAFIAGESVAIDPPSSVSRVAGGHDALRASSFVSHQPLLPELQTAPPIPMPVEPNRHLPQPSSPPPRKSRAESARREASPTREPDEIFIHIGRIDVAAVQQPAERPAPGPQRRSINLSEYLRRGNGRTR